MIKNLLIVESPAKAKTIEKFLGKDFKVVSSVGHIRDIPKKGIGIDIEKNFTPVYEISSDKKKLVASIRAQAKKSENIYLATDEDREGEAIAWHLCEVLGLDVDTTYRITFNEITESAIKNAIAHPRTLDMQLIDAQKTRRVIDRLVGYELSPILWRKISGAKAAGRVQSPTMRLVTEREREIQSFESASHYETDASFLTPADELLPAKCIQKFDDIEQARDQLKTLLDADFFISDISSKKVLRNPSAPFTTSVLQQEASSRLGFSVKKTMTLAQNLYRSGFITYMRTDSNSLASVAIEQAKTYIQKNFGAQYLQSKQYQTKSNNAQEAHEAIRPTDLMLEHPSITDEQEKRLYQLIWRRTLASQMKPASINRTDILISNRNHDAPKCTFKARGEILEFDGYFRMYVYDNFKDKQITKANVNDAMRLVEAQSKQVFSNPKSRYTEASLVKELERLGIGRPSTYATMISTVQERGYVVKKDVPAQLRAVKHLQLKEREITPIQEEQSYGAEKNKLLPTPLAEITTDFLVQHFKTVIDYDFTAKIEDYFDKIAANQMSSQNVLTDFYKAFHQTVLEAEKIKKQDISTIQEIGTHPETGRPISVRLGRYGPFVQMGLAEDEEKPVFASLPEDMPANEITMEKVLRLFELPRTLGQDADDNDVIVNRGRFGPYIKHKDRFISLKPPHDPMTIDLPTALDAIAQKDAEDKAKIVKLFEGSDIKILNGRFGPYITNGKKKRTEQVNVSIKKAFPDLEDIQSITLEQCETVLKNPIKTSARAPSKKKKEKKNE